MEPGLPCRINLRHGLIKLVPVGPPNLLEVVYLRPDTCCSRDFQEIINGFQEGVILVPDM